MPGGRHRGHGRAQQVASLPGDLATTRCLSARPVDWGYSRAAQSSSSWYLNDTFTFVRRRDFPVLDLHILLDHLGDAQVL